jgi:hypothetical protein
LNKKILFYDIQKFITGLYYNYFEEKMQEYNYRQYDGIDRSKYADGVVNAESSVDAVYKVTKENPVKEGFLRVNIRKGKELVAICDEGGFWNRE